MIDLHNHILPGVDDGAKTIEESIEMLHFAEDQGITDVVNTVHFQHPKMEGKNTDFDYISSVRNELLEEMSKENININIHLGAEVFFNFNLLDILDNPLITFCNGKYMLIEFQTFMMPEGYQKHLYDLKISGVTPVIAHPERYKPIQDNIDIVEKLINSGAVIQIDAGSLLGHFGERCKSTATSMIQKRLVHIIGSDAHGIGKRNFCLKEAIDYLEMKVGCKDINSILDNSKKIILGEEINPFEINQVKTNIFSRIKDFFQY